MLIANSKNHPLRHQILPCCQHPQLLSQRPSEKEKKKKQKHLAAFEKKYCPGTGSLDRPAVGEKNQYQQRSVCFKLLWEMSLK